MPRFTSALALLALSAVASAQTLYSQANIGATNGINGSYPLYYEESNTGSFVSAEASQSFTGLNSAGIESTMDFDGYATAEAGFNRLRGYTTGELSNAYYNEANAPFYQDGFSGPDYDGSPDTFASLAFARFSDTLTYGGAARSGYSVRYTFFVEGQVQGDGVSAFLLFKFGNETEYLSADLSRGGTIAQYLTTNSYEITGNFDHSIDVLFATEFIAHTLDEPAHFAGTGKFDSTAYISGISLYDPSGNLVSGLTVQSASGTAYPAAPVPEPATLAALALGGLITLRRRSRR